MVHYRVDEMAESFIKRELLTDLLPPSFSFLDLTRFALAQAFPMPSPSPLFPPTQTGARMSCAWANGWQTN